MAPCHLDDSGAGRPAINCCAGGGGMILSVVATKYQLGLLSITDAQRTSLLALGAIVQSD